MGRVKDLKLSFEVLIRVEKKQVVKQKKKLQVVYKMIIKKLEFLKKKNQCKLVYFNVLRILIMIDIDCCKYYQFVVVD